MVQFDEPALPAVDCGLVPTQSGLSRLAAVEADTVQEGLGRVLASTRLYTVVHCCAPAVPFGIIRAAGADAVAFDLSQLRRGEEDGVAEAAEAGLGLLTRGGPAVPATGRSRPGVTPDGGAADRGAGPAAVAAAGAAAGDVPGAGRGHAGLRPGRSYPAPGARDADPVPGGGGHG